MAKNLAGARRRLAPVAAARPDAEGFDVPALLAAIDARLDPGADRSAALGARPVARPEDPMKPPDRPFPPSTSSSATSLIAATPRRRCSSTCASPTSSRPSASPGAALLPMSTFAARFRELPTDRPLLVMCAVGGRSAVATAHLLSMGYGDVMNVAGGIVDWERAGLPVRRGTPDGRGKGYPRPRLAAPPRRDNAPCAAGGAPAARGSSPCGRTPSRGPRGSRSRACRRRLPRDSQAAGRPRPRS